MKSKERLVNDQGLVLLAQLGCGKLWKETDALTQAERVASRRPYVNLLLVLKQTFWKCFFVYKFL